MGMRDEGEGGNEGNLGLNKAMAAAPTIPSNGGELRVERMEDSFSVNFGTTWPGLPGILREKVKPGSRGGVGTGGELFFS